MINRAEDVPSPSTKRCPWAVTVLAIGAAVVFKESGFHAQSPAEPLRFDTASIVLNTSGDSRGGCCRLQPGGQVTATNVTLRQLILSAHQRHIFDSREISGGPEWIDTVRFDVTATAPRDPVIDADGSIPELWSMIRTLLDERFELKIHIERRQAPIYALVVANTDSTLGPRLRRSEVDCGAVMAKLVKGELPAKPTCSTASYPGRFVASALPMPAVASLLEKSVDRVIVDRTGLNGRFDVELEAVEIRPPGPFGPSYRPSDTKQSIFSALPEQLGLELKPTTEAVERLVVDYAEQPAELLKK